MKPKRIYQVYQEQPKSVTHTQGPWRFRVLAPRAPVAHRIVGGSQEAFDSKGNALRAARREASLYLPGVALVEVLL